VAETVLVTGAGGFIGSAVVARLRATGHAVIAFDQAFPEGKLDVAPAPGPIEVVVGDARDRATVEGCVRRATRVIHLAAIAGVHAYQERPWDVLDVNVQGTRNVVEAAAEAGVPVLFASSSEAYGKNPLPLREDSDTWLGPTTESRWCYAVSKLAGEHLAWALVRQRGLVAAAVRYFNVYGPLLDAPGTGRVLSQFLGAVQRGEPLRLVDGGRAVRCFCHIDDAARATVDLALRLGDAPELVGRPFNVGRAEPVTMAELAGHVLRLTGHGAGTVDVPGASFFGDGFAEIPHRVPDTSALREAIGFTAEIGLEDGLRQTLAHWGLLRADAPPAPSAMIPNLRPDYDPDPQLLSAYAHALVSGRTTNHGPQVVALEAEAARFLQVEAVAAFKSGADALQVGVRAIGHRDGWLDGRTSAEGCAILPSFTYVSTLNAVELAGLRPVFCEVDPLTFTMDPDALADLLDREPDARVVLPVCAFGVPPALERIVPLARARGVAVLYDGAHAVGAEVAGPAPRAPGGGGHAPDFTIYSLHATKVLPALEGGLAAWADPALGELALRIRTHGLPPDPMGHLPGLNAKLDEISAATARHGLRKLPDVLARRRAYDARLRAAATGPAWRVQRVPEGVTPNGQNFVLWSAHGAPNVLHALRERGIEGRRYFDPLLHQIPRLRHAPLPITEALHAGLVCLPLHSRMSDDALARLEGAIAAWGEHPPPGSPP
jgi:nucleoside-diphosphate-sugar epimerase/dTDP-4-amino-4,6-dideoxygalactose transaminase